MTQVQLNRAVAAATGESIEVIAALGFQHQVMPRRLLTPRWADRLSRFHYWAKARKRRRRPEPQCMAA